MQYANHYVPLIGALVFAFWAGCWTDSAYPRDLRRIAVFFYTVVAATLAALVPICNT